jgi:hypothetical protein
MTRREAILAVLSAPLARFTAMGVQAPRAGKAYLTLDLDKWVGIEITLGGKSVFISAPEIFNALNQK